LSFQPYPGFPWRAGKTALNGGKGYVWNPVGFLERPKDPNDPGLARESVAAISADLIHDFDGPLQTAAFTSVFLPVHSQLTAISVKRGITISQLAFTWLIEIPMLISCSCPRVAAGDAMASTFRVI